MDCLAYEEQRTLGKRFVDPSLWLEVQIGRSDNMLAMVDKIEETFKNLQPIFCRKVKSMDMKIIKGERALDRAIRIDAKAELADLESIKPQEIKLIKFCH